MHRTQIYLTDEQVRRIADRAADQGVSKAEVIRQILDAELDPDTSDAADRAVILATAGICADYPDWPDWLAEVRPPGGAAARLESLGL